MDFMCGIIHSSSLQVLLILTDDEVIGKINLDRV